uniref:Uncharacterized protein n=1 Tax=Setaria italica TaxID=4555 RepID=K3XTF1_SETIT
MVSFVGYSTISFFSGVLGGEGQRISQRQMYIYGISTGCVYDLW